MLSNFLPTQVFNIQRIPFFTHPCIPGQLLLGQVMAPKKRSACGGATGAAKKSAKKDPALPPDTLAKPHMKMFEDWCLWCIHRHCMLFSQLGQKISLHVVGDFSQTTTEFGKACFFEWEGLRHVLGWTTFHQGHGLVFLMFYEVITLNPSW